MTRAVLSSQTETKIENILTGKIDAKGRKMGLRVRTCEMTFVAAKEDERTWFRLEPGHYYVVQIQASKNGEKWGAAQPNQYFKTEAERAAAIAKRLAAASK